MLKDISGEKTKTQLENKNINQILSYFTGIAGEIGKEQNVSIKLSNSFKSLIVGWIDKNKNLNRTKICTLTTFESDLKNIITAEIQLLKKIDGENIKYWLIDNMEFIK